MAVFEPGVSSTNGPAQPAKLSRRVVITAALEIVDREGLQRLTMRRIGQRLGREAMSLYRYASSRDDILDGVVERLLEELDPPIEGADWRATLRSGAHNFRALVLKHPNVVPLLTSRPLSGPVWQQASSTLRPVERMLDVLSRAGFSPPQAQRMQRLYTSLVLGHVMTELRQLRTSLPEAERSSPALERLGDEFPNLRRLASEDTEYDGRAELDEGLTILFTGMEQHFSDV